MALLRALGGGTWYRDNDNVHLWLQDGLQDRTQMNIVVGCGRPIFPSGGLDMDTPSKREIDGLTSSVSFR